MDDSTAEILNRFNNSWDETILFFNDLIENYEGFAFLIPVREFLKRLEQKEGRKFYRVGTALHTLIISRSVNHGLRADQKYVKIEAFIEKDFEVTMRDGDKVYRRYRIKELEDMRVVRLLQTLKSVLID